MREDYYIVQKLEGGQWVNWADPSDYFRAQTIARLAAKYGYTTRIVNSLGEVEA